MKLLKCIGLFLIYPLLMLGIGFFAGVEAVHFFYPGQNNETVKEQLVNLPDSEQPEIPVDMVKKQVYPEPPLVEAASSGESLNADTEYVLQETDVLTQSVVETVSGLPAKYIGMNREQFLEAMKQYEAVPPLVEMERGFVSLEVLSFSQERVVVQMNYQYVQPSNSFYLAVQDNEVVVLLEDKETVFINTGIRLEELPEAVQLDIMQMRFVEDEEKLYDFLEAYSS